MPSYQFQRCVICGQVHDPRGMCPCPRCWSWHESFDCGGFCALPNSNRCRLCGELHNAFNDCPCNRCGWWHAGVDCFAVEEWKSSTKHCFDDYRRGHCLSCGQLSHDGRYCPCPRCFEFRQGCDCGRVGDLPCSECNIWHGEDACIMQPSVSAGNHGARIHPSLMKGRAVHGASIVETNVAAPAHSDVASAPNDVGSMTSACPHCAARFWVGESVIRPCLLCVRSEPKRAPVARILTQGIHSRAVSNFPYRRYQPLRPTVPSRWASSRNGRQLPCIGSRWRYLHAMSVPLIHKMREYYTDIR